MTNEEKLLPCPFCGYDAAAFLEINSAYVICQSCNGMNDVRYPCIEDAIDRWNTRAPIMTESELEKQDKLIAEIEGLKQSAEGSQMVEVCLQVDAYNNAIDDVVEIIRKYEAPSPSGEKGLTEEEKLK